MAPATEPVTSRSSMPRPLARVRSTSKVSSGYEAGCWIRASATPSIVLISARTFWAKARLSASLLPAIWMSIGAGAPKFRICEVTSAGRKEKVAVGKAWGRTSRSALT